MYLKLLALLTLLFSSALYASRPAIVVSTRAVIYADQELKSPIGFVSAGRKVVVGDVARKNGSILPIIVIGRVAWIKASDLALNTEELKNVTTSRFKVNEEQFKNAEEKFDDNLFENNYAQFSFGSLAVDNSYKEFGETTGYTTGDTATALRFHVFHRPPFKKSVWSVGVGYYAQSEEEYEWETITVEAKYGYSLLQTNAFALDAFAGVFIGGDFRYQRQEDGETVADNGSTYGYMYGGQLKLFTWAKFGLVGGLVRQTFFLSGLSPFPTTGGGRSDLQEISGTNFYFGLSVKL
ncbi:MAG: hypothetical protein EP319_11025 [Deltaproteobacteria bacterium]|nr:MAG: hypothetical protein EP319_11025 [Deltaproteobacteria bacterium]